MNHPSQVDAAIESFVSVYPPAQTRPVSEAFLAYATDQLPRVLVELYRRYGLGWFGSQQLELVDPGAWTSVVGTWLGPQTESIPFAVTSFGHVYHLDASGHVQCLDPHFLTNTVVAASVEEFFGTHLTSQESHLHDLQAPHRGAVHKLGELRDGEIYSFEPVLPLGGVVSPDSLVKVGGVEQLLQVHQLVRQQRASGTEKGLT